MRSVRLAIDVESGDFGPRTIIQGVLDARKKCADPFVAYLCGNRRIIGQELERAGLREGKSSRLIIEHCPDIAEPGDAPARVWKRKQRASVIRCVALQKEKKVDASLSAGHTGMLMGASIFLLGRMHEAARPALAAFLPTVAERPSLVLDVGANLECRAEHLATFGVMGYQYYQRYFGVDRPRVALLNIGHEPSKGSKLISEAGRKLERDIGGYCGFIEGGDVLSGSADVVVCDGFVGNVLLKACESFHILAESVLKGEKRLVAAMKKRMTILNSENYGAVPLLGIKGVVFKAHGSSSAGAICHALLASVTAVQRRLPASV